MLNRLSAPDSVVLLNEQGHPIGTAPRDGVHTADTPLHLAFSSYLFDDEGRLLITRRALTKRTWPGVWTNSCCGHPLPNEDGEEAVRRRVSEELGLRIEDLQVLLPDFRYRAVDPSGMVENEVCPVWVGRVQPADLAFDPGEIAEYAWVAWPQLVAAITAAPQTFSPWAALQVPQLAPLLVATGGPAARPGLTLLTDAAEPTGEQATVAAVDSRLSDALARLSVQWARWVPEVEVLDVDLPQWLADLAVLGGKRFRPRLGHWGFVAAGGAPGVADDQLVQAMAALELLHLFALLHDDVMDQSTTRRGAPAAHVQAAAWHRDAAGQGDSDTFGRNLAILAGDLAYSQAAGLAAGLAVPLRDAWHELTVELIAGQRADLTGAAAGRHDREHAERIARLKSGSYSVTRPLQLGALAAGANPAQLAAIADFGDRVGRAFAWRDDLLGVWGDPAITGKPAGDDLTSGKATVIMALATEAVGDEALTGPEVDVDSVRSLLDSAGVRRQVETMIADEVATARGALAFAPLTAAGKAGLLRLAEQIAWRQA